MAFLFSGCGESVKLATAFFITQEVKDDYPDEKKLNARRYPRGNGMD